MQCHHRSRRACRSSCYCNCSACWQARAFTPIAGKNARCPLESCCGFWSPVVVDFIGNATGIVAFRGMCVHVPMAWMRSLCNTSLPSSSLTTLLFVCASSCINVCVTPFLCGCVADGLGRRAGRPRWRSPTSRRRSRRVSKGTAPRPRVFCSSPAARSPRR